MIVIVWWSICSVATATARSRKFDAKHVKNITVHILLLTPRIDNNNSNQSVPPCSYNVHHRTALYSTVHHPPGSGLSCDGFATGEPKCLFPFSNRWNLLNISSQQNTVNRSESTLCAHVSIPANAVGSIIFDFSHFRLRPDTVMTSTTMSSHVSVNDAIYFDFAFSVNLISPERSFVWQNESPPVIMHLVFMLCEIEVESL